MREEPLALRPEMMEDATRHDKSGRLPTAPGEQVGLGQLHPFRKTRLSNRLPPLSESSRLAIDPDPPPPRKAEQQTAQKPSVPAAQVENEPFPLRQFGEERQPGQDLLFEEGPVLFLQKLSEPRKNGGIDQGGRTRSISGAKKREQSQGDRRSEDRLDRGRRK